MPKRTATELQAAIQYSETLATPERWIDKARELLAAASLIEPEIDAQWSEVIVEEGRVVQTSGRTSVHGPYFTLVAYAVENLLKACRIHQNRDDLANRIQGKLPGWLKSHDLVQLAERVGFEASLAEEDLLVRLSRNSIWAGRYPVPVGPGREEAVKQYSDGRVYLMAYFGPKDVANLRELVERVRTFVKTEIEESAG